MKTIIVGNKPKGSAKGPAPAPIKLDKPKRESFVSKMLRVMVGDVQTLITKQKVVLEPPPEGWEDYQKFCELARGKK